MSFQPINVEFLLNSDEVKTASDKVKKSLMDIGLSAEDAEKKISQKLNASLERQAFKTLPLLEQQGVKTKRVWNGLGNSINQLSREMPAFAVNAQTGFLAISNNLPIFADEIQRIRDKNAALTASGEKSVPVWKQVAKGIFSWQTLLSVGVSLLTVYGAKIFQLIRAAFQGKAAFDAAKESVKALNKAFANNNYQNTISDILTLTSVMNLAKEGVISKEVALKKYNKVLGDVAGKTEDINEADRILKEKAPAFIKAVLLRTAAMIAAADAAKLLVEKQQELFTVEEDIIKNQEKAAKENKPAFSMKGGRVQASFAGVIDNTLQEDKDRITKKITEIKDDSVKLIEKLNAEIATIASEFKLNLFGEGDNEDSKTGTIDYYKKLIAANDKLISSKKTVNDLDAVKDIQAENAEYQKQIDLILSKEGLVDKDPKAKVSSYQSLIDKISAIDAEYTRKSFTKDQEELQALKDKFAKVRTLVERFNADPKNKAQIIDLTAFNAIEGSATTDLVFRQETDILKKELQEQKKLYKEFVEFKKTFGADAAQEEYEDQIGDAESYYDFLKKLENDNATAFSAVKNGTATGAQTERVNFINSELKTATKEQQTEFNKQLEALISYNQKRTVIIENYNAWVRNLMDTGRQDQIAQATKNHQEELDNLDDANIKKLGSYKALQRGIVSLTKQEAKVVIDNAKALLDTINSSDDLNISDDLEARIKKAIAGLEVTISQQGIDDLFNYTLRLGEFGEALSDLGDALGSSDVKNAGAFLSGIAGGLDDFFNVLDAETKEEKIAAGIGAAISLITIFTGAAAKRKAAEQAYYLSVIGFQNEYNLGLQEQKRLQSELGENIFLTDYAGRLQDGTAAIFSANEGLQASLDKLQEKGKVIAGQGNGVDFGNVGGAAIAGAAAGTLVGGLATGAALGSILPGIGTIIGAVGGLIGGLLFGGKKKDEMTAILTEFPQLIEQSADGMRTLNVKLAESLIANNLVKGETKQILENILGWQEALEEARAQINEVISELTGGLGDDLRNTLVDAFVAGEDAAIKMGETVEKVLENVLSNFIFNQIFQTAFDELQDQMAASFDLGGDNNWVDDFGRFFTSASGLTDDFNQAMQDAQTEAAALGFSIFDNATNNNALTGGIRRELTEQTGTELLGLFRGFYDLSRFNLEQMEAYLEAEKGHHITTLQILAINTQIEANTREMILQMTKSNQFLESIDDTTENHYLFIQ
jgi:hypothetical protein